MKANILFKNLVSATGLISYTPLFLAAPSPSSTPSGTPGARSNDCKQRKNMSSRQSDRSERSLTLPGPARDKGTKVERKDSTVRVTLPKA